MAKEKHPRSHAAKLDRAGSRWEGLNQLLNVGIGALFALITIFGSWSKLSSVGDPGTVSRSPSLVFSAVLLATMAALICLWLRALSEELRMLRDHFKELIPDLPPGRYPWTIAIAVPMAAALHFWDRIAIFAAVFGAYDLINIWGNWILRAKLREAFHRIRSDHVENGRREGWQAIETYYVDRPQDLRHAVSMFLSFVALGLGLYSLDHSHAEALLITANTIMIVNIVISEVVIHMWRRARDVAIGDVYH